MAARGYEFYLRMLKVSLTSEQSLFIPNCTRNHVLTYTNNTVKLIFNGKTYIFNDTTYCLFFNTFVTFGVP